MSGYAAPPPLHTSSIAPPPIRHEQTPPKSNALLYMALGCGGLVGVCAIALVALVVSLGLFGAEIPDTAIIPGAQVPENFLKIVQDTGVLEPGEELLFFYSDKLSVEDGFYLLTNRKVVLHDRLWANPKILVPFEEIENIDVIWSDSFYVDSSITLKLMDGSVVTVPASTDYDRDHLFHETLAKHWEAATGKSAAPPLDPDDAQ